LPFTLIAHRGYSSEAPENTLEGFELALASGFNNFELDAQLTRDGVPVVIHDDTVDRTTNGHGAVRDFTMAEIKALDAGSWFTGGPEGAGRRGYGAYWGVRVPSLAEVLDRCKGRAHIHLELKSREQILPSKVAEALRAAGYVTSDGAHAISPAGVTISSFYPEQLHRSRRLLPGVNHGWLLEQVTPVDIDLCVKMGLSGIYPRASTVTAEDVRQAGQAGLTVRTWGVGDEASLHRAFDSGAAGTTVDWPGRAKRLLGL
jgi:glycerophosphoryl diester phosphodiesterase